MINQNMVRLNLFFQFEFKLKTFLIPIVGRFEFHGFFDLAKT